MSALICGVAFLSYLIINVSWVTGFELVDGSYVPQDNPLQFRNGYRYLDWSVTVPLLAVELLAVLTLVGRRACNVRALLMASAFAMIVTGYLGAEIFGSAGNDGQRILWGLISTGFYVVSVTDVAAKVGFGVLIHKIAKMRTAEDMRKGEETHPEAVYVSHDKLAEPRPPHAAALDDGRVVAAGRDGDGHGKGVPSARTEGSQSG